MAQPRRRRARAHARAAAVAPTTTPDAQDDAIAGVLERAVAAGEASVMRTPDLLAVLREAGVVDAGGYGAGRDLRGDRRRAARRRAAAAAPPRPGARHASPARLLDLPLLHELRASPARALDAEPASPPALEALGDSVLVVGDARTLKIHVHTDQPEQAIAVARRRGRDLPSRRRRHARPGRRAGAAGSPRARAAACSRSSPAPASASCSAASARTCSTADRRSTRRPTSCSPASTPSPPRRSSCCPTAPNVIMAAERAAELSEKQVVVVPSRSQQTALAALVAHLAGARSPTRTRAAIARRARARAQRLGGARRAR